jgi:hypothetical protein
MKEGLEIRLQIDTMKCLESCRDTQIANSLDIIHRLIDFNYMISVDLALLFYYTINFTKYLDGRILQ